MNIARPVANNVIPNPDTCWMTEEEILELMSYIQSLEAPGDTSGAEGTE